MAPAPALTRLLYGFVALPMPVLVLSFLSSWFDYAPSRTGLDFLSMWFWAVLAVLGLLLPALRAWWRMCRREGLMPAHRLAAHAAAGGFVLVSILIAIGIVIFMASVPDDYFRHELGVSPAVSLLSKAVMALLAGALLVGEWIVMGRED